MKKKMKNINPTILTALKIQIIVRLQSCACAYQITRPQVRAAITMLELIDILRTFESATRARQLHRGQVYVPYVWE